MVRVGREVEARVRLEQQAQAAERVEREVERGGAGREAREVAVEVDHAAVDRADDLVDAVAEEEAAVVRGDPGLGLGEEGAAEVDERVKHLASVRAAMVCGCEWCLDFGSSISEEAGVGEEDLRELALARDKIVAATEGGVRTVIVRAPKLVNVVPV